MPIILQCNYTIILASKYIMSEFNYVDSLTQGFRYASIMPTEVELLVVHGSSFD